MVKLENNWRSKILQNLEKEDWGDGNDAPTNLIKRCLKLRKIQLSAFTVEDLRLMIGQQIGLNYLVPLAIEKLTDDLFAEGDLYPGDLLENVLKVDFEFWKTNQELWVKLNELILDNPRALNEELSNLDKFRMAFNNLS